MMPSFFRLHVNARGKTLPLSTGVYQTILQQIGRDRVLAERLPCGSARVTSRRLAAAHIRSMSRRVLMYIASSLSCPTPTPTNTHTREKQFPKKRLNLDAALSFKACVRPAEVAYSTGTEVISTRHSLPHSAAYRQGCCKTGPSWPHWRLSTLLRASPQWDKAG